MRERRALRASARENFGKFSKILKCGKVDGQSDSTRIGLFFSLFYFSEKYGQIGSVAGDPRVTGGGAT